MNKIEGIVCKVLDYKDTSKILYIYTKNGHKSIIARGVKKMTSLARNLAQVGNVISFEDSNKEMFTLKDGELINDFENIHFDLTTYTFVSHILELTYNGIDERSDHNKMYNFLDRLLQMINRNTDPEVLTFIFELKLLYFLGYGLNFKGCNQCESIDLVFSVSDGGLTCLNHKHPNSAYFDSDIYTKLKYLYYLDIDSFEPIDLSKNERILMRHILDLLYDEYVGLHTKSRNILKQIIKY